jgi:hypothetical protein
MAAEALRPPPLFFYRTLGRAAVERQGAYPALFHPVLDAGFVDALRAATNGDWALGNARFKQRVAKALKRRVAAAEGPAKQSNDGPEAIKSTLTPFLPCGRRRQPGSFLCRLPALAKALAGVPRGSPDGYAEVTVRMFSGRVGPARGSNAT